MNNDPQSFPKLFGSMVFNEDTMKERLSPSSYRQWKKSVSDGTPLELSTANEIAVAMMQWAVEKGATHYTHWFQPMTGVTAEKHDSFISTSRQVHPGILRQRAGARRIRRVFFPFRRSSRDIRSQGIHRMGSHFLCFY